MLTSHSNLLAAVFSYLLIWETSSRELLEPPSPQDHVPLAACALQMAGFFATRSKTFLLMENCFNCLSVQKHFNNRLLDYMLLHATQRMSYQLSVEASDDRPWNYNIFIVDSALAFEQLSFYLPDTMHERNFHFLIVLTGKFPAEKKRYSVMRRIFETCLNFNVLNAVIMLEERDSSITFYTYNLYELGCRQRITITEVNRYRDGVLEHDYLFPPRLGDFHQCALRVSGYVLPPILTFEGDIKNTKHLREMQRLSGIEGEVLKVLAEALNFRIKLSLHREKSIISTKHNWTGYLKELYSGNADIAIGGLSASDPNRLMFTVSTAYKHSPLILVICNRPYFGLFRELAGAFDTTVWLCIALCLLVALVVIKALHDCGNAVRRAFVLGADNTSARTNVFRTFFGSPLSRLPRRNFARFLIIVWVFNMCVLRQAYQAKMFQLLQVPQGHRLPNDLNQIIANHYYLLTSSFYDFYPKNRSILVKFNFSQRFDVLEKRNERLVSLALLDNLIYYKALKRNSALTYVKEPVYVQQEVMYFRKHSVLKATIDRKLMQLMAAGITSHIAKKHLKRELQAMKSYEGTRLITNNNLLGLYIVYMVLMGVAVLCFGLELLSERWKRCRRIRSWLQAVHSDEY